MEFTIKKFNDLSHEELYNILALRQQVFIVEQECNYLDADGKDFFAVHVLGKTTDGTIAAYCRIFDLGLSFPGFLSIGRVIVAAESRKYGLGKGLMNYAIAHCQKLYGNHPIKIGAQKYLLKFYNSFGFEEIGIDYLEDGIPHTIMVKSAI